MGGEIYNKQIKFSKLRKSFENVRPYDENCYKSIKIFPLVQGKYQVVPPPPVPDHIIRPPYINNNNPEFGKYEGRP